MLCILWRLVARSGVSNRPPPRRSPFLDPHQANPNWLSPNPVFRQSVNRFSSRRFRNGCAAPVGRDRAVPRRWTSSLLFITLRGCLRPRKLHPIALALFRMSIVRRRFSAWIALVAMACGLALPAHAYGHRAATAGPGDELCVGGKIVSTSPGVPTGEHAAACDACTSCSGGAHAPMRDADLPAPPAASAGVPASSGIARAVSRVGLSYPRGPPAVA